MATKKTKRAPKKKPTVAEKIAKGHRCKHLLEDEDLRQAFLDVRDALHDQFDQIAPSDIESMRMIKERLHLLFSIEKNLLQAIKDGQLEEFILSEQERPAFLGDLKNVK